jgi:1,4-dihydroxy-2-naphthoate octaprenyltransferase
MEAVHTHTRHVALRAAVTIAGAAMLFTAPASALGIFVMLIGLICAVGALTVEKAPEF